jgi:hypothetical protein
MEAAFQTVYHTRYIGTRTVAFSSPDSFEVYLVSTISQLSNPLAEDGYVVYGIQEFCFIRAC